MAEGDGEITCKIPTSADPEKGTKNEVVLYASSDGNLKNTVEVEVQEIGWFS